MLTAHRNPVRGSGHSGDGNEGVRGGKELHEI
jgi:hypothetical protein